MSNYNSLHQSRLGQSWLIIFLGTTLIGLCLSALFFAAKATKYSREAEDSKENLELVEAKLKNIETVMEHVNIYSDAIDELTVGSISKKTDSDVAVISKVDEMDATLAKLEGQESALNAGENLNNRLEDVAASSERLERTLSGLVTVLKHHQAVFDAIPSITPTEGFVSSGFGERVSPFSGHMVQHHGLDIGADAGTKVVASADGIVEYAGSSDSFGKLIVIKHAHDIWTRYAHNSKILVRKGQAVVRGQKISLVGSTGHSTGPHLHYEVWVNRKPVDPRKYLLDKQLDSLDIATAETNELQMGGEEFALPDTKGVIALAAKSLAATSKASLKVSTEIERSANIFVNKKAQWRKYLGAILVGFALFLSSLLIVRSFRKNELSQLSMEYPISEL